MVVRVANGGLIIKSLAVFNGGSISEEDSASAVSLK